MYPSEYLAKNVKYDAFVIAKYSETTEYLADFVQYFRNAWPRLMRPRLMRVGTNFDRKGLRRRGKRRLKALDETNPSVLFLADNKKAGRCLHAG